MSAAVLSPRPPTPYGASELKDLARALMSRAAVVSSTGWVGIFLLLMLASPWMKSEPIPPIRFDYKPHQMEPAPILEHFAPMPTTPAQPVGNQDMGVTVPVPEAEFKVDDALIAPPSAHGAEPCVGCTESTAPGAIEIAPPAQVRPERGKFYYVEEMPIAIQRVQPAYPDLARQAGIEGKVTVDVLVGLNGSVMEAVIDGDAPTMFDQAALEAARRWVFKPALVNDQPRMVWVKIPFSFTIH